jgi:hypothetical protein
MNRNTDFYFEHFKEERKKKKNEIKMRGKVYKGIFLERTVLQFHQKNKY